MSTPNLIHLPPTGGAVALHLTIMLVRSAAANAGAASLVGLLSSVDLAMGRTDTTKSYLDIVLDAPFLILRGTGTDVEPTSLSGHVALFPTESTSCSSAARQRSPCLPPNGMSFVLCWTHLIFPSLMNSTTSITYVVCNHDWSFLEGDKRHSRTLKAGRHFFPFHLEIGGTLPSSIHTGASHRRPA